MAIVPADAVPQDADVAAQLVVQRQPAEDLAEADQQAELTPYDVLDTTPQPAFDTLTRAAADVAGVPTAMVSLIDVQRQWFTSRLDLDAAEIERDIAFDEAVRSRAELVVTDTLTDPRFAESPLVSSVPHIRFYAGFPLRTMSDHMLGTLAMIGYEPHELTEMQRSILRALADQVVTQLELRRQLVERQDAVARITGLRMAEASAAAELSTVRREALADRKLLTTVLDTIDVGVVACDSDGRLTVVNRAAHGFSVGELGAAPTAWINAEMYAEDGTDSLDAQHRPLFQSLSAPAGHGNIDGVVLALGLPGPDRRLLSFNAQQVTDRHGSVNGAVVAMTDITESRRAAAAVAAAHEQLAQALDAMPRSVSLVDVVRDKGGKPISLRVRWVNAHVLGVLNCELGDVVGQPFSAVFPKVAPLYEGSYLEVARSGEPLSLIGNWYDGAAIHGAYDVTVTTWGDDGLLIDVVDVTARCRAEDSLRVSEQRLREAQALAGLAAWEWDLQTDSVVWSPLMFRMFGIDPDVEPTGELMLSLVHPDEREGFIDHIREAIRGGRHTTLDFQAQRPDGRRAWIRATATIERDPSGRAVRAWGTDQDISASRAKEQELARAANTDPLTGVLNRRGWETECSIRLPAGTPGPVAVVMLDLDHFKQLNDTLGHDAGDHVLRECAKAWRHRLRAHDLIARLGGEEFALLLIGCAPAAALRVTDSLRASVPDGVTASAGIADLRDGETLAAALKRADEALYVAKASGRNQTSISRPD